MSSPEACVHADSDSDSEHQAVVLYSAELRWQEGNYLLVVSDRRRGTVRTSRISAKAVDKLPAYLSMLGRPVARHDVV